MQKGDLKQVSGLKACFGLIITQFGLFVLTSYFFGITHPLIPYFPNTPLGFVGYLLACIFMVAPLYLFFGYLYILSRNRRYYLFADLLKGSIIFAILMVILFLFCLLLAVTRVYPKAWTFYILTNYPMGIAMTFYEDPTAWRNLFFLPTTVFPSLFFFLGGWLRIRNMKKEGLK